MRAFVLALLLGLMSLGSLALTPSHVEAREWHSFGGRGRAYPARWHGVSHYRGWYGGGRYYGWYGPRSWHGWSHYYYPAYGYYYPSYSYYYPTYSYYYPGYSSYYYYPGYASYYYNPYPYYYSPGISFSFGW